MSLSGAVIILILLGGIFAKSITLSFAMKKLEKDDIDSHERLRQSLLFLTTAQKSTYPTLLNY